VPGPAAGASRFGGDDGSADPAVAVALADFSAGRGSEHDAVLAIAGSRLLVPIVAAVADAGCAVVVDVAAAVRPRGQD
jgi:hypothetical protein